MTAAVAPVKPLVRCQLTMPDQAHLYDHILANAAHAREMCGSNTHVGQSVVICGAGPSLATVDYPYAHQVWGCNSALPYLRTARRRVTHGFCIDQGVAMLDEWRQTFAVPYYVASSVHPKLVEHLLYDRRRVKFFHSYLGIPDPKDWTAPDDATGLSYEMWLYTRKFPTSVQVGHGLNSVPRAVCLALFMGFERITVVGADCACAPNQPLMPEYGTPDYAAWMESIPMYADGRTASCFGVDAVLAEGMIDGKRWHTRPDMVVSARHLLELQRKYPDRITFVGDTLVTALAKQPPEFFDDMPALTGAGLVEGFGASYVGRP